MREFFKPWRRKMRRVALLFACVFTGAWIRSLTILDFVVPCSTETLSIVVVSTGSEIDCYLLGESGGGFRPTTGWQSAEAEQELADLWRIHNQCPQVTYLQRISYWWIVVPLTLVSACLLLTKPKRQRGEVSGD